MVEDERGDSDPTTEPDTKTIVVDPDTGETRASTRDPDVAERFREKADDDGSDDGGGGGGSDPDPSPTPTPTSSSSSQEDDTDRVIRKLEQREKSLEQRRDALTGERRGAVARRDLNEFQDVNDELLEVRNKQTQLQQGGEPIIDQTPSDPVSQDDVERAAQRQAEEISDLAGGKVSVGKSVEREIQRPRKTKQRRRRFSDAQRRRSQRIAQSLNLDAQLSDARVEDQGPVNTFVDQVAKPSAMTLANIGGSLARGTTELATVSGQEFVQSGREQLSALQRGEPLDPANEFVTDVGNLDFTTDTTTAQDIEEDSPIKRFALPETNNPLSEGDIQSALFTTGGAVAVPLAGTLAGPATATTTGTTIEVVDQAPNVARLGQSIATGNIPGISSSTTAIGVDLLPIGTSTATRGKATDQATLGSDFDRGKIQRARKQEQVDTSLDVEPQELQGFTVRGGQSRLDPDAFRFDKVDERLPSDLTIETQSGEVVASNRQRNVRPTPERTDNIEVARAEQKTSVPGEQTRPDDQTRLDQAFTDGQGRSPKDVEGVVEGQTGQSVVTDEGVVKVEETPRSSLDPFIDDKKGSVRPVAVTESVTPSTDIPGKDIGKNVDTTSPGKATPSTDIPGKAFIEDTSRSATIPFTANTDTTVLDGDTAAIPETDLPGDVGPVLDSDTVSLSDTVQTGTQRQTLQGQGQSQNQRFNQDADTTTQTSKTNTSATTQTSKTNTSTNTTNTTTTTTTTNTVGDFDFDLEPTTGDFEAQVKQDGEFEPIGEFDDRADAFQAAKDKVENTAAMTFRVQDGDGDFLNADLPGTRPSKSDRGGLVELREDAIDTEGEKQEISPSPEDFVGGGQGIGGLNEPDLDNPF